MANPEIMEALVLRETVLLVCAEKLNRKTLVGIEFCSSWNILIDFLDIVLPKPVLSAAVVDDLTDFRIAKSDTCNTFRGSDISVTCPFECTRPFPGVSVSLPFETIGDECLLGTFIEPVVSGFPFIVTATPGRDLPAESGLSGKVVLRFGGVSRGKSGGTTGCCGGRIRGPGELGRDDVADVRPFERTRPTEVEGPEAGDTEGNGFRRVGVDEREFDRVVVEFKFAGICALELGVEDLEFWDCRVLSIKELAGAGRTLDGVEGRDVVGRADGVEGLAVDGERAIGEDGLV
ncbi:hypothetical protein GH714_003790 [Hevea brasiliensis]|uniref:Uncharacterized protein n=1 Tax=Hevea brasiliensis TaxID=3981 RepID=A0A6A6KI58_HEVBR|nr:hypothetical protein GH714_003790 [Hevea brasiliensis]